jgi:AMMECR1 domain-containing protein
VNATPAGTAGPIAELSQDERRVLLAAAREAIAAQLAGRRAERPPASGAMAQRRGAFVTLRRAGDGELRGCVGQMEASEPLLDTVAERAVAAATRDGRFAPVSGRELDSLRLEISVPRRSRRSGRPRSRWDATGCCCTGDRRGCCCLKCGRAPRGIARASRAHVREGGLPRDTWKQQGVELFGFTATVFGEDD